MSEEAVENIIQALEDLKQDATIPKNLKNKIESTITVLNEKDKDISLRVNKALHELDEITDETNIEPFIRTQIWNIVSMLEMIA